MTDQDETAEGGLSVFGQKSKEDANLPEPEKASNDPLQAHLRTIRNYPLLTEEERVEAFKRYRHYGDQEARELLIVSSLRLVVKIALGYRNQTHLPLIDVIQEGNIGLIKAIERYDPDREVKFSYYAAFWIKAHILKHIKDNWKLVKLITNDSRRRLFSQLLKEKERLRGLGKNSDTEELAKNLQVKPTDVLDMEIILNSREISLDEPMSTAEGSGPRSEFTPSEVDTEKTIADYDFRNKAEAVLDRFRETLSKREAFIFDNRIYCDEALTLESIANVFGLSRERIRQNEKLVYKKLYRFKEVKEAMALIEENELTGVTLSEVKAVTNENTRMRKIALLYFGLNDEGVSLRGGDIVNKTGIPRTSVSSSISQIKQMIRNHRVKRIHRK